MYFNLMKQLYACHSDNERRPSRRGKFDEKLTYGCGYMDVRQSKTENFTTTWGPIGFTKENHSLWIMVRGVHVLQRLNLEEGVLPHPQFPI